MTAQHKFDSWRVGNSDPANPPRPEACPPTERLLAHGEGQSGGQGTLLSHSRRLAQVMAAYPGCRRLRRIVVAEADEVLEFEVGDVRDGIRVWGLLELGPEICLITVSANGVLMVRLPAEAAIEINHFD